MNAPSRPSRRSAAPRQEATESPQAAELADDADDETWAVSGPVATRPVDGDLVETRQGQVLPAEHGARLDRVLVRLAGEFSRTWLQRLAEAGHVRVQGAVVQQASRRMQVDEQVEVDLQPTPQSNAFRAEAMDLSIVFEDEHLLVVDKPAGLVVHPAAGHWSGTLLNGLLAHHAAAAQLPRAGIVHRLDKDTSGLMLVAKSLAAATALTRAIAARDVQRRYRALVHGVLSFESRRIDAPVGRDPQTRVRMAVHASGKPAQTDVQRLAVRDGVSAVQCSLLTGRTHQIRVHMASIGHPLVGDGVYGGKAALGMARQALHAWQLALAHPVTGQGLVFESQPPADLRDAWAKVLG